MCGGVLWGTATVEAAKPARLTAVLALKISDFAIYEQSDRNAVRRMLPALMNGEHAPYRKPESLALLQDPLRKAGVSR